MITHYIEPEEALNEKPIESYTTIINNTYVTYEIYCDCDEVANDAYEAGYEDGWDDAFEECDTL